MNGLGVRASVAMLARCVLNLGGKSTAVKQQDEYKRMNDDVHLFNNG